MMHHASVIRHHNNDQRQTSTILMVSKAMQTRLCFRPEVVAAVILTELSPSWGRHT